MKCNAVLVFIRLGLTAIMASLLMGCVLDDLGSIADGLQAPKPGDAARMMFDPHNADNRRRGTSLLANSPFGGSDIYVKAYRDMVEHEEDIAVRAAAIRALSRHGDVEDAARVAVHLQDESRQVRWEAAKGLQRLHDPEVVPALLLVVRNPAENADVREAAVTALGQYPEDRVVRTLVESLRVRELAVNRAAEQSLKTLTGQDFGLEPRAWIEWYDDAMETETAFAHGTQYLYPVYSRDLTWVDKINIFNKPVYESPNAPAGLRNDAVRQTYQDDAASETGDPSEIR